MSVPAISPSSRPEQRPELAMTLMLLAMLVLPGIDAIAKWLSSSISAGQVAWTARARLAVGISWLCLAFAAIALAIAALGASKSVEH